jgi:hypothetical protein
MQRQTHNYYFGSSSSQYSIERIADNGRAFQGQVNELRGMTNSSASRAQPILDGYRGGENQAEGMLQTNHLPHGVTLYADISIPSDIQAPDNHASDLYERLENSVRQAVTFQLKSDEALEAHYGDNNKHNFDAGDVYRVWHPTNTEVHLCTFLVLFLAGTSMTCLKIVHCDPEQLDYKFESEHGRLRVEYDRPGSSRRSSRRGRSKQQEEEESESYLLHLYKNQRMKENCWIDMLNPWNINWQKEYLFAYCGRLEKDSFLRAREDHLNRYDERVRGSRSVDLFSSCSGECE